MLKGRQRDMQTMSLVIYGAVFWIFAIAFMAFKSRYETKNALTIIVKMVPAISAAVFILLTGSTVFYLLLAAALIFCGLGDMGMEINILPGLGLFLIAHFIYTGNFLLHGFIGASVLSLAAVAVCIVVMLVYLIFYFRYLKTAEKEIPAPFMSAAYFYAIMILLTAASSLLLWLTTGALFGFIPFIGALLFVASDSMIVIQEFHHRFKYDEMLIFGTYYLAIFFLALGAVIFTL